MSGGGGEGGGGGGLNNHAVLRGKGCQQKFNFDFLIFSF